MDFFRHLFFENPQTLWVLLGIGAILAGVVWRRMGSRHARTAAVVLAAAAVAIGILAWAVETDREKLLRSISTMNMAANDGPADAFIERISPSYRNGPLGKDHLAAVVRQAAMKLRASGEILKIDPRDKDFLVTQVYHFRPAPNVHFLVPPEWQNVTWEGVFAKDPDGQWRLRSAVATHPRRITPEEAGQYLRQGSLR